MSQRLVFSLRYYNQIFYKYAKTALTLVFFLTLIRLNLFFLSTNPQLETASFAEVYMSFLTGARFDLLVLGFVLIPVVLGHLAQALSAQWLKLNEVITKVWLIVFWVLAMLLNWIDFYIYHRTGLRARWPDYAEFFYGSLVDFTQQLPFKIWGLFAFILLLMLGLGIYVILNPAYGYWKDSYSPQRGTRFEIFMRIVLPLALVAVAARGTFEPHHLDYRHSLISNDTRLNEMALNPMWCLDKDN
ncbi:MAG: hypothetical protein ACLGGX_03575 [Bdellovibrionia bacterium]